MTGRVEAADLLAHIHIELSNYTTKKTVVLTVEIPDTRSPLQLKLNDDQMTKLQEFCNA